MTTVARHDRWSVECIGSFALVTLWEVPHSIASTPFTVGRWGGCIRGNDAVIVTRELRSRGMDATCRLLDPTDFDLNVVTAELGKDAVVAVGNHPGRQTHSLCLEDPDGRRWVFSRMLEPRGPLEQTSADIVYVDYYRELVEFLNRQLAYLEMADRLTLVNVSGMTSAADMPKLAVRPSVLQASVPKRFTPEDAAGLAMELGSASLAQRTFVTMGARGAVLAIGRNTWHSAPGPTVLVGSALGAGAVFSAHLILGLVEGYDGEALLEWSVRQTAIQVQTWSRDESHCP